VSCFNLFIPETPIAKRASPKQRRRTRVAETALPPKCPIP